MQLLSGSKVSLITFYKAWLNKEKTIYCQLNKFQREGSLVYGFVWTPFRKNEFMNQFNGHENDIDGLSVQVE